MPEDFKAGFLKTLWILRDYLHLIVIGGGWVPFLYYRYLLAYKSKEPIRTRDIDLLVDIKVPMVGDKSVDQLLLDAGLKPEFYGSDTPAVIHYEGTIDGAEVEIEFLTDQRGPRSDPVIEVQKGLHAEALRFISILINHTIEIEIDDFPIEEKYHPLTVKAPSPEAYIFHKGLIFERRKEKLKKEKDLFYIFEILANCPELKKQITEGLNSFEKKYPSWFSRFVKNLQKNFSELSADGILMISKQRPAAAFPNITEKQFEEYVFGIFQELMDEFHH
jgi:hypothetical protein